MSPNVDSAVYAATNVVQSVSWLDRISADLVNFVIFGAGIAVVITLVISKIFQVKSLQDLVFPGREPLGLGVKLFTSLVTRDTEKEPHTEAERILIGFLFLGMSLRNGLVFFSVLWLVGRLTVGN